MAQRNKQSSREIRLLEARRHNGNGSYYLEIHLHLIELTANTVFEPVSEFYIWTSKEY